MMFARHVKHLRSLLWFLALCLPYPLALAQTADDLDDITIRVIGLDEIPSTTMQVVDFPEPDLGEMNNIQEGVTRHNTGLIQDSIGFENGLSGDAAGDAVTDTVTDGAGTDAASPPPQ